MIIFGDAKTGIGHSKGGYRCHFPLHLPEGTQRKADRIDAIEGSLRAALRHGAIAVWVIIQQQHPCIWDRALNIRNGSCAAHLSQGDIGIVQCFNAGMAATLNGYDTVIFGMHGHGIVNHLGPFARAAHRTHDEIYPPGCDHGDPFW